MMNRTGRVDRGGVSPAAAVLVAIVIIAALALVVAMVWSRVPGGPAGARAADGRAAPEAIRAGLDAADVYRRQGKNEEARAVLEALASQHPEDQEVRVALAQVHMFRRDFAAAYAQLEAALAIGPRTPDLEFSAGTVANQAGRPERAVEHYSMAQSADPTEPVYPLYLGQMQRKLGRREEAKATLLMAANLDPDNAVSWGTLADIALEENKLDIALQHVRRARALQPEAIPWRLVEARALKRRGQPAEALECLVGLSRADRRDRQVARAMAECYAALGRPGDAAAVWADASDAAPDDPGLAFEAAAMFDQAGAIAEAIVYARRAASNGSEPGAALLSRLGG